MVSGMLRPGTDYTQSQTKYYLKQKQKQNITENNQIDN